MARSIYVDLDFLNVSRLIHLPDAIDDQEPATLAQVKSYIEGLAWKDSARVKTQGNLTLSAPGASIDGTTMVANDRVLVASQTVAAENGVYVWYGADVPMSRALDANSIDDLRAAIVPVEVGTNGGTQWRQTQIGGSIGVSDILFTPFAVAIPLASETAAGRIEIATQAETDAGSDDERAITPLKLATWVGKTKRYTEVIGNGTSTTYTINHNLSSRNVQIQVYRSSGDYDAIECGVNRTSASTVTLTFKTAPSSSQFIVVVTG